MSRASYNRKGECPEGHNVAHVTFDDLMYFKPDFSIRNGIKALYETQWPDPRDTAMRREHEHLQRKMYEAMALPPELLTPAKIRTLVENHAITLTQKEPTAMIKMETYLNGKLLSAHTDEELFAAIRKTEAEINSLRGIENKPKALKDRINTLQADIDGLVKYMDAR